MQARILTDRIDVYQEHEARNETNEIINSFSFSFFDRAEPIFQTATERANNGLEYAGKIFRFKVRFNITRYNERQLIKWRGDYYNVRGIEPDKKRKFMILTGERAPVDSLIINE